MGKFFAFLFLWLFVGLVSMIFLIASDLRGQEYDDDYFDEDVVKVAIIVVLFGFISPLFVLYFFTSEKLNKNVFTYFIYKLVNIGYKPNIEE